MPWHSMACGGEFLARKEANREELGDFGSYHAISRVFAKCLWVPVGWAKGGGRSEM